MYLVLLLMASDCRQPRDKNIFFKLMQFSISFHADSVKCFISCLGSVIYGQYNSHGTRFIHVVDTRDGVCIFFQQRKCR